MMAKMPMSYDLLVNSLLKTSLSIIWMAKTDKDIRTI